MAGINSNLVSGANALIVVNGKKMVMAQDLNYSVRVDVLPVEVMGSYEVVAYEPIGYSVSGSFSITRYLAKTTGVLSATPIPNSSDNGNGIGQIGLQKHLNPAEIAVSETFDIVVYKKGSLAADDGNPQTVEYPTTSEFTKLSGCRITGFSSTVSKRSFVIEQYQFVATLYDDESFNGSATVNFKDLTPA